MISAGFRSNYHQLSVAVDWSCEHRRARLTASPADGFEFENRHPLGGSEQPSTADPIDLLVYPDEGLGEEILGIVHD